MARGNPILPHWVPSRDRRRIDDDELAAPSVEVARETAALARELGCYAAAYRRGAPDVLRGLCFFYRAARLTPSQLHRLRRSERRLRGIVVVAYQSAICAMISSRAFSANSQKSHSCATTKTPERIRL